jgi:cytochrome c peroxidase
LQNAFAQKGGGGGRIGSRIPWIFLIFLGSSCGDKINDAVCDNDGCLFSNAEWERVSSLEGLGPPPADPSNAFIGNTVAIALGHRFYFDTEFSGASTWVDTLGRTTSSARSVKGTAMGISCASCHNPSHAGVDTASSPGHVSVGAGWYDVNSQPTVNSAYYRLQYWNGRTDSLWAQAAQVMESGVSMNGNRLAVADGCCEVPG